MSMFVPPYLKGHELVVRFRSPGVDFHRVLQSNHQKLDPLIFHWKHDKELVLVLRTN